MISPLALFSTGWTLAVWSFKIQDFPSRRTAILETSNTFPPHLPECVNDEFWITDSLDRFFLYVNKPEIIAIEISKGIPLASVKRMKVDAQQTGDNKL